MSKKKVTIKPETKVKIKIKDENENNFNKAKWSDVVTKEFFDIKQEEQPKIKKGNKEIKYEMHKDLQELFTRPQMPSRSLRANYQVFAPNEILECDTLMMPEDSKRQNKNTILSFRYIMVCVDTHNKITDAIPMVSKNSFETSECLKMMIDNEFRSHIRKNYPIYKPFLKGKCKFKIPKEVKVDNGTEFKKEFRQYVREELGLRLNVALTNRHQQLAVVEGKNRIIGGILSKAMANSELLTNQVSTNWLDNLPLVIEVINKNLPKPITEPKTDMPIIENKADGEPEQIIEEGQLVRVKLDYPIDSASDKRIGSTFRESDIRWSKQIYKIAHILIKPNFPIQYLTNKDMVARSKWELQIV